jgi:M6 family metalloprotease-like protein
MKNILILMTLFTINMFATGYINPNTQSLNQTNGYSFQCKYIQNGDMVWAETIDGYSITRNGNDNFDWYYAILDESGILIPSEYKVSSYINGINTGLPRHITPLNSVSVVNSNMGIQAISPQGIKRIGVILIEFPDDNLDVKGQIDTYDDDEVTYYPNSFYSTYLFSEGYYNTSINPSIKSPDGENVYGSMRDYYHEVSLNALDLQGEVWNNIDQNNPSKYSWLVAELPVKEYFLKNRTFLLREAIQKARDLYDLYPNQYKNPNYDAYIVIYAGSTLDKQDKSALWPNADTEVKGIIYNEKSGLELTHIGAATHEFGHLLGLADKYKKNNVYMEVGTLCLMGTGDSNGPEGRGSSPAHINAIGKVKLGWANISSITGNFVTVEPVTTSNKVYVYDMGSKGKYYFEFRKGIKFDKYTVSSDGSGIGGLAIWHEMYKNPILPLISPSNEILKPANGDYSNLEHTQNEQFLYPVGKNHFNGVTNSSANVQPTPGSPILATGLSLKNIGISQSGVNFYFYNNEWAGLINFPTTFTTNQYTIGDVKFSSVGHTGIDFEVKFGPGVNFFINHKFDVEGTTNIPIVFTTTEVPTGESGLWGSLILSGAGVSGSIIDHLYTRYATEVKVVDVSFPSYIQFKNCTFFRSVNAVRFTHSFGWILDSYVYYPRDHGLISEFQSTTSCYNNFITQLPNTRSGAGIIYSASSTGHVWKNFIQEFEWGVGAIYDSSPIFGEPNNQDINNHISDNDYGLYIYNGSYPYLGSGEQYCFGNAIHDNTYKAMFLLESPYDYIYAEQTYWGGIPNENLFTVINSWGIDYANYLGGTDPWHPEQAISGNGLKINPLSINTKMNQSDILHKKETNIIGRSLKLRNDRKYSEAFSFLQSCLDRGANKQIVYNEFFKIYNDTTKELIRNYLNNQESLFDYEIQNTLAKIEIKDGNIDQAKNLNKNIILNSDKKEDRIRAYTNQFYTSLYIDGNKKEASNIMNKLNKDEGLENQIALSLLEGSLANWNGEKINTNRHKKSANLQVPVVPNKFDLLNNFPNPFNPTTTISYSIPEANTVHLTVYDNLGREVEQLVNGFKKEGKYDVVFNATKLSSGIYYYKIVSGKYSAVKKMLLLK